MRSGPCRLCNKEADLQNSHLLPATLYRRLRLSATEDGETNSNPVLVTPKLALQTSKQVRNYLLCRTCEQLLNIKGEKWVAENCWHSPKKFRLKEALDSATPTFAGSGRTIYTAAAINGIGTAQIIHFAASVFWRAAAHQWSAPEGHKPEKLRLGPYEEKLRRFVIGEADFPVNVVLLVSVNSNPEPDNNEHLVFPYLRNVHGGFREFMFVVPGIAFKLFVGRVIPTALRAGCTVRSKGNLICVSRADFMVNDLAKAVAKVEAKGGLRAKK